MIPSSSVGFEEMATFMNSFIDIFFLIADGVLILAILKSRQNSIFAAHAVGYLLFVLAIGGLYRFKYHTEYGPAYYFYAHILILVYFIIVFFLFNRKRLELLPVGILEYVGERTVTNAIFIWATVNLALFFIYGFGFDEADPERSYLVSSMSSIVDAAGNGAMLMIAAAIGQGHKWRHRSRMLTASGVYVILILLFNLSGYGARRTLLALTIFVFIHLLYSGRRVRFFTARSFKYGFFGALILLVASGYYQQVRVNIYTPSIAARLNSEDVGTFMDGVLMLLTPRDYENAQAEQISRPGPLDVLTKISGVRDQNGISTNGEILWHGLLAIVPKALYPDKPTFNEDLIVVKTYGPISGAFMINYIGDGQMLYDISTSPLVYYYSDFGFLGVMLSALIFFLTVLILTRTAQRYREHRVFQICVAGLCFDVLTSFESASSIYFLALRDLAVIWVVFVLMNLKKWRFVSTGLAR